VKKLICAAIAAAFFAMATLAPNQANAISKPVVTTGGASTGGVWAFLGVVGFIVAYDIVRRTTCSGDFLRLGGPGFNQPIGAGANVLAPRKCANRK
jgi:hypothetical protein